jgi:hypothetical protein
MASTIKVNNIQNQCGANIANKCGSTITLGASGDTITLACGASQTGFGRTGTVDWDTTAKTASFTAVSGNGYFVNTTSGAVTVTLPATPSAGDIVALQDYAGTWGTNNVTIGRNGSNVGGAAVDATLSTSDQSITFVYVDATRGWQTVNDSTQSVTGPLFITATGGTVTCCGDYKIHTFTGPGTFTVTCAGNSAGSNSVDYLVVAGGGAGGGANSTEGGGGGGAGGYRESHSTPVSGCYTASPLSTPTGITIAASPYPISVGAGGTGTTGVNGNVGSNSIFSTITSTGGGGGGKSYATAGGSGGGGGSASPNPPAGYDNTVGGAGNTPPVSPPQGNAGGGGTNVGPRGAGGGGGATVAGTNGTCGGGGPGGAGATTSISASPTTYAGGGGGGSLSGSVGSGGPGGGGAASLSSIGTAGTSNTGGGGGGSGGPACNAGANGGSGIVIIRYKYQ